MEEDTSVERIKVEVQKNTRRVILKITFLNQNWWL